MFIFLANLYWAKSSTINEFWEVQQLVCRHLFIVIYQTGSLHIITPLFIDTIPPHSHDQQHYQAKETQHSTDKGDQKTRLVVIINLLKKLKVFSK